ncbi:MAG: hypothetical protein K8T25_07410 [Planctomycetia bacterium]|nr:hypothetical protein [Planctomycetia bacterium]
MSIPAFPPYAHSPEIEMWLVVGSERLPLAQVSRDSLLLAESRELPPQTTGQVVVTIDGRRICRDVILVSGVQADTWADFI